MFITIPNHRNLFKKLWAPDETLRPNVAAHMMKIARAFIDYVGKKADCDMDFDANIRDVIFCGTHANYQYTRGSDIDIHIFIDLTKIPEMAGCPLGILSGFMLAAAKNFAADYEPSIYGKKVEVVIFDASQYDECVVGSSWSVLKSEWIERPRRLTREQLRREVAALRESVLSAEKKYKFMKKCDLPAENSYVIFQMLRNDRFKSYKRDGTDRISSAAAYSVMRRRGLIKKLQDYGKSGLKRELTLK